MDAFFDVVIVGAGHGGAQAAIALRQLGFQGSVALVGDEPEPPYERPPLSKEYLSGDKPFERMLIRPISFWAERDIALRLATRVEAVDPNARRLTCSDGETIGYGDLIWATGGAPRRLPGEGHDLTGVHTVRTRADADRMRSELSTTTRAVVIGGGYIGLEAAAMLAKAGKQVSLIEAQDRLLARVAGKPLSEFYEAEHRAHGVDVRCGVLVDEIVAEDGHVVGVSLQSGELLPCEMVIVGIGIVPAVQPLIEAGAEGGNGVSVDAQCRTSLEHVYAIGDVAMHANPYADGATIRVESVQNANDQALVVAKTITGLDARYEAVPWFWSNQYDLRLQTVGLTTGHDTCLVRGAPSTRSFSVVYLREGHVIAIDCVNATRDYVQGRRLVEHKLAIPVERLANAGEPLKLMTAGDA